MLGLPPTGYKSAPYRSRAVRDPRGVLAEFGVTLPPHTDIRVWDSTAEVRYLVVPMRPVGSEDLNEEELAALVTRDSMIGSGLPRGPEAIDANTTTRPTTTLGCAEPLVSIDQNLWMALGQVT